MSDGDITYYEARRQARSLLGQHADVMKLARPFYPALVGLYSEVTKGRKEFVVVGAGATYADALLDARQRQALPPVDDALA